MLLLHHRKLNRWLQPGGHADPDEMRGEDVAPVEPALIEPLVELGGNQDDKIYWIVTRCYQLYLARIRVHQFDQKAS